MKKLSVLHTLMLFHVVTMPSSYLNSKFTIRLPGLNFGVFELVFWFFCWLTFTWVLIKRIKMSNFTADLMSKLERASILAFGYLLSCSVVLGVVNRNELFLRDFRSTFVIIPTFTLAILHFNYNNERINVYYNRALLGSAVVGLGVILSFFSTTFADLYGSLVLVDPRLDLYRLSFSGQKGMYSLSAGNVTMFAYFVGMSNLLLGNKKKRYYFLALLGLVSTNIFFHKPIVVAFVIGNVIMFVLYVYLMKNARSLRNVITGVAVVLLVVIAFVSVMPSNLIQNFISYFRFGWLNIGRTGVEHDLSSGRFDLFYEFGVHSLKGLGLAPWGLGKALREVTVQTPHNYLIYIAHNVGVFGALCLWCLIMSTCYRVLKTLKRSRNKGGPLYAITFALLVYVLSIVVLVQYSGVLDTHLPFVFLFYSSLAIMTHLTRELRGQEIRGR